MWITFSEFIFFSENKIFTFVNQNTTNTTAIKFSIVKKKVPQIMWITFFVSLLQSTH